MIGSALGAAIVGVLLGPALGGLATVLEPGDRVQRRGGVAPGLAVWAWTMPGIPAGAECRMRAVGGRCGGRP